MIVTCPRCALEITIEGEVIKTGTFDINCEARGGPLKPGEKRDIRIDIERCPDLMEAIREARARR